MAFGVESRAPHGGVFVLFATDPWWAFLISLAAGTVVTALILVALKRFTGRRRPEVAVSAPALATA